MNKYHNSRYMFTPIFLSLCVSIDSHSYLILHLNKLSELNNTHKNKQIILHT